MIYINEYTGEKFKSAEECQKSEQEFLKKKQKLEEKKRLDKAKREAAEKAAREKERKIQQASIALKQKFGKNAILKGINLQEGATTIERNNQVGGHKAGK